MAANCGGDPQHSAPYLTGTGGVSSGTGGTINAGTGGGLGVAGGFGKGSGSFPQTDSRVPVTLEHKPPAIQGGTLLALRSGGRAFVADPDRDRVLLVDTVARAVIADIPLGPGAEPGRAVEDAAGLIHVVLRGTGEVVTIDAAGAELTGRRAVCAAPRGIAVHPQRDALVVACAEGTLVELPTASGEATAAVSTDADLRDIVVQGETFAVTRFRSAELLTFDLDYQLLARRSIEPAPGVGTGSPRFESGVAWRTAATPSGSLMVVHQRATTESISVSGGGFGGATGDGGEPGFAGAAGFAGAGFDFGGGFFSGYSDGPCTTIVQSNVSTITADGAVTTSSQLMGVVLPVDVAVSANGLVAVASAGAADPFLNRGTSTALAVYPANQLSPASSDCVRTSTVVNGGEQVVAVAFDPVSNELFAQTREPATLVVLRANPSGFSPAAVTGSVALGGESVVDTGHEIFNRDTGSGIACASCHPEGTEDGHVWRFDNVGARRTQSLDVGLRGTEPFHWAGDLPTLSALMDEVFVLRMNGPMESNFRIDALQEYLFSLPRRAAVRTADDPAVVRGQALFEAEGTGCLGCHNGETFTNNQSVSIGKGPATQVPSLIAVSRRLPVMHDGCAKTLLDRFDPACGGDQHGDVSMLSPSEVDDLVAYLESL